MERSLKKYSSGGERNVDEMIGDSQYNDQLLISPPFPFIPGY